MESSSHILLLSFFLLLSHSAFALNITKILADYPDFSTFNSLLTQSKLAAEINSRETITVLAIDNGAAGALSGKPEDELKRVLSVHVVLDYFDEKKLSGLSKKSTLLTTLFQSSGLAVNQQGFINITKDKSGEVHVGSAVPGAGLTATIIKEVTTRPFNISVLQVSGIIYPTGIENVNSTAFPPPPKTSPPAASPKADADTPASAPSSTESDTPALAPDAADAPSGEDVGVEAPTPGLGPSAAEAPGSDVGNTGASSPGPSSEDADASSASSAIVSFLGFASIGLPRTPYRTGLDVMFGPISLPVPVSETPLENWVQAFMASV
ncbi:fasciclin-like arabinogalactan protein 3 [Aristolochia californica]|uniref:fasciclin-like arabinogalactan protein 3 n=1 Tax=Aristolochia californica TaxID=171875 RepID=UPI0035E32B23